MERDLEKCQKDFQIRDRKTKEGPLQAKAVTE